jgi:cation diffusion facilitator CzcD-associated flavoprotein CzcO
MTEHVDALIVGAGLSGIGAACYLQTHCPKKSYAILEGRDTIGGTWDLFRYPGVRSDSDMYTLGYSFRPWRAPKAINAGRRYHRHGHWPGDEVDEWRAAGSRWPPDRSSADHELQGDDVQQHS